MNSIRKKTIFTCVMTFCLLIIAARSQTSGVPGGQGVGYGSSPQNQGSGDSDSGGSSFSLPSLSTGQDPFRSSAPEGKATSGVLPLSFKEAIDPRCEIISDYCLPATRRSRREAQSGRN